ncbi:MAG: glycerophosphodiester phosphodiesterase family protein [Acidimicrobiales bacterium]
MRRAHAAGWPCAWTVDDPAEVVRLARLGVDGVITNVPAVAVAALRDAGLRPG